jgi:PPIC-type PPIASE domain
MRICPLLREPLFHFVLIGALVFAIYSCFAPTEIPSEAPPVVLRRIEVSEARLRELLDRFRQNEGRVPSHAELTHAADGWVHDEVLFREALLRGLDRNDPVVRQRLVKLMQWHLTGTAKGGEPSEAELRSYYDANHERYRTGGGVHFEQIFFSTARRGATAETDARAAFLALEAGKMSGLEVAIGHGDSLGGDKALEEMQRGQAVTLAKIFGAPLISIIQQLPMERWSGPYQSTQGWHVVKRVKPSDPTFEEMRLQMRSEVMAARGATSPDAAFKRLLNRYDVRIENLPEEARK